MLQYQQGELRVGEGECPFANSDEPPIHGQDFQSVRRLWLVDRYTAYSLHTSVIEISVERERRTYLYVSLAQSTRNNDPESHLRQGFAGDWRDGIVVAGNRRLSRETGSR